MDASRQAWVAAHPFLEPVARFQELVDGAAARAAPRAARPAALEAWAGDAAAGVPLLRSAAIGPDLAAAAADALGEVAAALDGAKLPAPLAAAARAVRAALASPAARARPIAWIVAGAPAGDAPEHPGLLRHLAWSATRRVLAAALPAGWCDGRWGRAECPGCGALPGAAQLVPGDGARPRFLACALCGTRWRWRRIGCPSCGNESSDRLAILDVDGEDALRIDVCGACDGYLKTYTGEGEEALLLADWTTLHLDVVALERGLTRVGASLYELPGQERRTE
jgi:FdhE protein